MDHWAQTRALSIYYSKRMRPVYMHFGLSSNAFSVLMCFADYPFADTAKKLVEVSGYKKAYISTGLRELEQKDMIIKSFQNGNHKTVHLERTEKSDEVVDMARKVRSGFERKIFADFSDAELTTFRSLLARMHLNLTDE